MCMCICKGTALRPSAIILLAVALVARHVITTYIMAAMPHKCTHVSKKVYINRKIFPNLIIRTHF